MEEIMDVEKWLAEYKPPEVEYAAAFDPQTGSVTKVGPARALINEFHKASIDQEVAEKYFREKYHYIIVTWISIRAQLK